MNEESEALDTDFDAEYGDMLRKQEIEEALLS